MYLLKAIHLCAAFLSITGFCLRWVWMLRDAPVLRAPWVRIAPHVVDTILLASAVALAWRLQQFPFRHDWLTAKVLALMVYIALGLVALRFGRSRLQRALAGLAAVAVFGYIVGVALTRNPGIVLA